jgi:hypothetical protein
MNEATVKKPPESQAAKARRERLERIKITEPRIRVEPATDAIRRLLKHPTGLGFLSHGSAEWPHDRFTRRRLAEGSIKEVQKAAEKEPVPAKHQAEEAHAPAKHQAGEHHPHRPGGRNADRE